MPIYQNSIIYKLCHCNDLENNNIYVGSTTNFRNRKSQHKSSCNNQKDKYYNFLVYQFIRDNGNWNEWQMIPIEVFPCNDKKELEVRERYHIELLKSKLNKQIPTRTKKEHYNDNKEKIAENKKEHYNDNKEQILEKNKEWNEANKEKIKEYYKQWSNDNKEQLAEKQKKYRDANREKKLEKTKEKVICNLCGAEITKSNIKRHQKSKKCIESI
jgi:hypothetical protein